MSIARRTTILGFARLARQAITFLSPIFLVRLLTVEQFGEFRDFLLYGTILFAMVEFSINSSLAYFVPKEPIKERVYFTQATLFVLCTSTIAVVLVLLLSSFFPSESVQSNIYALSLYIFFSANLEAWEVYWIAKSQTSKVFYYTVSRLGGRTAVVIAAAYLTANVNVVIWSLVAFEGIRLLIMSAVALKLKMLTTALNTASMKTQLSYFGPLGSGNLVYTLNVYIGQFFVSAMLGSAMLAIYTIGTFLSPIIQIFRSSISDVIMPEIVSMRNEPTRVALILWQRATIVYCVVMLPMAVLFFYFADVIVKTLFTSEYQEAVPIFQIFVFLLVRECFDFGLPIRVVNRTGIFLTANLMGLIVNFLMMLILYQYFGVLGPAIAMIITRFLTGLYLALSVMRLCRYRVGSLLPWYDVAKVTILCLGCAPILLAMELLPLNSLVCAVIASATYSLVYTGLLTKARIPEIDTFVRQVRTRLGSGASNN